MSDDLTAALRGFAEQQHRAADATAPDPAVESGALARRVSRRRAVRTGTTVLSAAAVVGVVAAGVFLSGSRTPPPPAIPVPTSTTTPSPARTPTTTPVPTVNPTVPAAARFRDAEPMTPGMLEAAGEGWFLVGYSAKDEQENVVVPDTGYLLSPDGRAFVVPTADLDGWQVRDWLPRSSLVVAMTTEGSVHVVDLMTGEAGPSLGSAMTIGPAFAANAQFVGDGSSDVLLIEWDTSKGRLTRVGADGVVRATTAPFESVYGSAAWLQSPDRSRIVVNGTTGPQAVATDGLVPTDLPAPYPDRPDACRAWMWVDDAEVLMECTPAGGAAFAFSDQSMEFWLVPVDGAGPRQVVGLPVPERLGGVWRVGDQLVAGSFGPSESAASWWEITGDGVAPLSRGGAPELEVFGVRGSELLATLRPYARSGALATVSLVAIDPVRGTTRTVVEGEPGWFNGLTVMPSRFVAAPQTGYGD